ncbi:TadE/TadG family type IV pilus assembly protein [Streptantibioticus ferralitis]
MALELSVIAPVVILLLFATIQAGLFFHAREVAHRAAQLGVDAGRSINAAPGDGPRAATSFLDRMGGSLQHPHVSPAGSSATETVITVAGDVATLVPGLTWHVVQRVQAPHERWINR